MKYFFIVNPVSGFKKGNSIAEKAISIFNANNIQTHIVLSEEIGHPYILARDSDLSTYDGILVLGGDGTIHEVINGIMDRNNGSKLPVGIIPGGTGNSLAHDLGIVNPEVAIQHIINRNIKKIDLAKLTMPDSHIYSFNIVGWGLAESINTLAEKWRKSGSYRYDLASIFEIFRNPKWKVKIRLDDKEMEGEYSFFLACNTIYSGNGMKVAPKAILNDGKFDVLLLKNLPRWKLLRLFIRIFSGNHIKDPMVTYVKVKSFEINPEDKGRLNIDGNLAGTTPFKAVVLKEALELII